MNERTTWLDTNMDVWDNYIIGGEDTGGVSTFIGEPSYIAMKTQGDVMIDDPSQLEQIILQENIANEMIVEQSIEVGNDDNGEIILVPNGLIKQEDILESGEIIVGTSIGNEVIIEDDDCAAYATAEHYGATTVELTAHMDEEPVYDTQLVIDTASHIKLEEPEEELYHCGECPFILNSRTALKKHIKEAHGKVKSKKKKRNDNNISFGSQVYTCLSCTYTTRRRDKLDRHAQKHVLNEGFHPCGKKRQKIGAPAQRHRHNAEEYKCAFCPYSCTVFRAIKKHMKLHESGKHLMVKYSCKICGKDRPTEPDLEKHMKKHRNGDRFMCDLCNFMSVQLKKIIQHRRMHTGEKPHLCPFCDYRSARRDNLRSHVRRMHKKENMYIDTFNPNEDLEEDSE